MPVEEATIAFNAMLEGLGNAQLRGDVLRVLPAGREEETWRRALETVVGGFTKRTPRAGRKCSGEGSTREPEAP